MSETPIENEFDESDPTDTLGPEFQQVDKETQDDLVADIVTPDVDDDESVEDPA